jgi:UDP-MurNAc hydroxylase
MKVTMVSHASVLIEDGPIVLLTDPWLIGEVFNESWSLLCPPLLTPATLQGVTHIWISHEHPDHLHFPTLKAIPAEQKANITLLYQRHFSSRVFDSLTSLGFRRVIKLPLGRWLDLGGDVSIMCCSVGTIDSLLVVRSTRGTVLNVNDCVISPWAARAIAEGIGPVDVLLPQFSIASWAGNPGDTKIAAADEVLRRARLYIRTFKPKVTIPFASFVYFSHDENRYMNAWINTPDP